MKTHVQFEFRSNKFPPYDGEEEQINPGLWGKRLAEYVKGKLAGFGIQTGDVLMEDWGCLLLVRNETFELSVACGHQYGDPDEFLCFITPTAPAIRKWFKKIDTTKEVGRVSAALEEIFRSDSDIRELRCLTADET